jgi:Ca2+-binding RTX toxin-like protein
MREQGASRYRAGVRTRAAVVAAATVTGLFVAPTSAGGIAPTCQGHPATIVAGPRNHTTWGTEGDDVIVGRGATIDALGGDDLICLRHGSVYAGDGDDSLLVTGTKGGAVYAVLGAGDDAYVGGSGSDYVTLDDASPGSDTISTGAGRDIVAARDPDVAHRFVADLGTGRDSLWLALSEGSAAQVQAGTGSDELSIWGEGESADYSFDLGSGVVIRSGVEVASLPGFERYELDVGRTSGLRVLGTPRRDSMEVTAGRLDLHLGEGRDFVYMYFGSSGIPSAGVIDLGPDRDSLRTEKAHLVVADLGRGFLRLATGAGRHANLALLGVEGLRTIAPNVVLRGGPGADQLSGRGCHLQLRGRAGADHLAAISNGIPRCGAHVIGGTGSDRMVGGASDDRLVGGRGIDEALAGAGVDTCSAERTTSCEP